ncbi:hypothetical protein LLG95_02105 [bacterium]|nr:hypothetical protein [bacterium]
MHSISEKNRSRIQNEAATSTGYSCKFSRSDQGLDQEQHIKTHAVRVIVRNTQESNKTSSVELIMLLNHEVVRSQSQS